jgi:CDGSH-type Zn-finger protein
MTPDEARHRFGDTTYVLPVRRSTPVADDQDLTSYLAWLARRMPVIVVDGSPPEIYAQHHQRWSHLVRHISPVSSAPNGKVAGVCDGVYAASTAYVVIADDDVRYDDDSLTAVVGLLSRHQAVIPQNYFQPSRWHTHWDTGRTLLNRAVGHDYAGTVALTRSDFVETGGYCGAVLFENLELARTLRAAGLSVCDAPGIYVARRPPTARQFLAQRTRQAYDSHAQPLRFLVELGLLPAVVASRQSPGRLAALAALVFVMAEVGRRRAGGTAVWTARAPLWAPAWVLERSVTSWAALLLGRRGGVRYHGKRLKVAAHRQDQLHSGRCPERSCSCELPRDTPSRVPTASRHHLQLIECRDGPILVRGATSVRDKNNAVHPITRPLAALCRCGKSSRHPWCDGTHKLLAAQPAHGGVVFNVQGLQVCEGATTDD